MSCLTISSPANIYDNMTLSLTSSLVSCRACVGVVFLNVKK